MSGPHIAYVVTVTLVGVFAVVTAWRSADNVIEQNRPWTRAWRIFVTALAFGPSGWLIPFGSLYIIARYGKVWTTNHGAAAEPS
jgi:hypothetical protein